MSFFGSNLNKVVHVYVCVTLISRCHSGVFIVHVSVLEDVLSHQPLPRRFHLKSKTLFSRRELKLNGCVVTVCLKGSRVEIRLMGKFFSSYRGVKGDLISV